MTVVALAVVGLLDSAYLAISHYRNYADIGYQSFCAISRAVNCDTVSQSPYALLLDLPVAVWGIIGYAFLLILLLFTTGREANKKRIWSLIFWLSLAFTCGSVILALISTFRIRSYCIMCIVTYGVNFLLVYYAWLIRRRFSGAGLIEDTREDLHFLWHKKAKCIPLFLIFVAIVVSTWIFFPTYWHLKPPPLTADIPHGFTEAGHPWIGAERPVLEITEFADYQCFQCWKMHFILRQLMTSNPGKFRIIHRNYPMDHEFNPIVREPFHIGSAKLALLAAYGASKNKFWQMNDLLYIIGGRKIKIGTRELANILDLDSNELARSINDPRNRHRVKHDIYVGNKLGITGTPAYVIDGVIYQGQIPSEILKIILK